MRARREKIDDNALFVIAFEKTGAYNTNRPEQDQIRLIHPAFADLMDEPNLDFKSTLLEHEAFTGNSTSRRIAFPMLLPGNQHYVLVMFGLGRDGQTWVHILDSAITNLQCMPRDRIIRLARHYFGERELNMEYGTSKEVERQGYGTNDCGIHAILNLIRYFNDSLRFLGPMHETMKITEHFGDRIMDFRKEWADRLETIRLVEMPALEEWFAGDNNGSQVLPNNRSNTPDPIVLDDDQSHDEMEFVDEENVANQLDKPEGRKSASKRMKLDGPRQAGVMQGIGRMFGAKGHVNPFLSTSGITACWGSLAPSSTVAEVARSSGPNPALLRNVPSGPTSSTLHRNQHPTIREAASKRASPPPIKSRSFRAQAPSGGSDSRASEISAPAASTPQSQLDDDVQCLGVVPASLQKPPFLPKGAKSYDFSEWTHEQLLEWARSKWEAGRRIVKMIEKHKINGARMQNSFADVDEIRRQLGPNLDRPNHEQPPSI